MGENKALMMMMMMMMMMISMVPLVWRSGITRRTVTVAFCVVYKYSYFTYVSTKDQAVLPAIHMLIRTVSRP